MLKVCRLRSGRGRCSEDDQDCELGANAMGTETNGSKPVFPARSTSSRRWQDRKADRQRGWDRKTEGSRVSSTCLLFGNGRLTRCTGGIEIQRVISWTKGRRHTFFTVTKHIHSPRWAAIGRVGGWQSFIEAKQARRHKPSRNCNIYMRCD